MSRSRRNFIKKSSAASAAIVLGGVLPGFSASQYRRIIGSNEKIMYVMWMFVQWTSA